MASLLAKNAPKQWQNCERCGSKQIAASYSVYCVKCEHELTRTCRTCGQSKPLDAFALCSTGIDGRARHCKVCKESARRYGSPLLVSCASCGSSFEPKAGGDRYCRDCKQKPRPKPEQKAKTRININSVIYMRW